jgi:asparagine synthase (glutamine-hydrolysing)
MIQNSSTLKKKGVQLVSNLLKGVKENRSSKLSDLNRKFQKLNKGFNCNVTERYWNWASFIKSDDKANLLINSQLILITDHIDLEKDSINDVLVQDQRFVLPNDMLVKVDVMSMSNSLEVRTPFLDHNLVDYVNTLSADFKVNKKGRKQILIDSYKDRLPKSVYERQKKGFEIPLKSWIGADIERLLFSNTFSEFYIKEQGIFKFNFIDKLRRNWLKSKDGDQIYLIWTLMIFQNWWDKNIK